MGAWEGGQCILLSLCKAWHKFIVLHAQYLINMWYHKINNSHSCKGAHLAENLDSGPDGLYIMKSLCYSNFDRNAQALYFDSLHRNSFGIVPLFPIQQLMKKWQIEFTLSMCFSTNKSGNLHRIYVIKKKQNGVYGGIKILTCWVFFYLHLFHWTLT